MELNSDYFWEQAAKCRRLAAQVTDPGTRITLIDMAREYSDRAAWLAEDENTAEG